MVTGDFSPGVKRPEREADHSTSTSAEVQEMCIFTLTPHIRLHGVELNELSTGRAVLLQILNDLESTRMLR
jgi:hypothetical protein